MLSQDMLNSYQCKGSGYQHPLGYFSPTFNLLSMYMKLDKHKFKQRDAFSRYVKFLISYWCAKLCNN